MTPRALITGAALIALTMLAVWNRMQFAAIYGGNDPTYVTWAQEWYFGGLSSYYLDAADGLVEGRPYSTAFYPPGYPAFLAGLRMMGVGSPAGLRRAQLALDSLGVVLMFLAARLAGRATPWCLAAAAAYALHPLWASASTFLLAESLSVLLVLATLTALLWAVSTASLAPWIVPGLLIGCGALVRPDLLLLAAPVAAWTALTARPRVVVRRVAILALGVLLLVGPWGWHNKQRHDAWLFTSSGGGVGLWQGLGDFPNELGYIVNDSATAQLIRDQGLALQSIEADRFLKGTYLAALREHPGHVLRMTLLRWKLILFDSEKLQPLFFARARLLLNAIGVGLCAAAMVIYRRNLGVIALVALPVLHALSGIGLVHYEPRYVRYVQLSYVFAGVALMEWAWRATAPRWPRVAWPLAMATVLAIVAYSGRELRHVSERASAAAAGTVIAP